MIARIPWRARLAATMFYADLRISESYADLRISESIVARTHRGPWLQPASALLSIDRSSLT